MEISLDPHLKIGSDRSVWHLVRAAFNTIDSRAWVVIAALVAFVLKVAIALNTFGTNDVAAFYMFARSLHDHGLEWTYQHGVPWSANPAVFNHPPLTAYYLELIESVSRTEFCRLHGLTFPFLLRFPGIVADLGTVAMLLWISKTNSDLRLRPALLALFALSPVSFMVSGFHGNTDPVMVMFLVLAVCMCLRQRPVLCGLFLALSCQVKIVPLLLLPIFFFFWLHRQSANRFTAALLFVTVAMWSQPLINFPTLFARNVLAYTSYWGSWGVTYWLQLTGWAQFTGSRFDLPLAATIVAALLKVGIILAVAALAWYRRRHDPPALTASIAYAWIIFFVFTPGFCSYYLVWLAPFILLLSPSLYVWLTAASSLYLFVFYDSLAGGLPWFIAISKVTDPIRFNVLAPWSLWPWAVLIVGLIVFWNKILSKDFNQCAVSVDPLATLLDVRLHKTKPSLSVNG